MQLRAHYPNVADLLELGARKLSEADIRSEIISERLRERSRDDDGEWFLSWIWKHNEDGTAISRAARGAWEVPSTWWIANDQYCRGNEGEDFNRCSSVYELDGVYRFTETADDGDPNNLSGWSVVAGAWDAGQLLYDGETLNARNLSAMRLIHQDGEAELIDPVDFSIRRTEGGDYVVTLDGFGHTFTPDQRNSTGAEGPSEALDIEFSVYGSARRDFNENLDAGHSGGNHVIILGADRDHEEIAGQDPWLRTFATFGNPITDFSRMNDVTATYSGGWAWLEGYVSSFDADNFDWDEDLTKLWSDDMAFTADFSNGTISGRIQNFKDWDSGEAFDMTLTMPETSFGTQAFSGGFDVSGETLDQTTASYDASFWGPDATQLAGTMSISGTEINDGDSTPFAGVGHFEVGKDQ